MTTPRHPVTAALACLGVTAILAASGCARAPGYRYFQPTAAQMGAEANSFGETVIPRQGLIVVQGDDLAYGLPRGRSRRAINGADVGQAGITISQALRKVLKGVRIDNRGFPGDTVARSGERWASAPQPNLLILAYGYGDLQAHTTSQAFSDTLGAMVTTAQAKGTAVFLLTPPPLRDPLKNAALEPYRAVERAVASITGATLFDGYKSTGRIVAAPSLGPAQTASVYQAMAADMIPYIRVVSPPVPQIGQSGSGDSRTVRVSAASAS